MIGLEAIENLLDDVFLSGWVKGAHPLSLILVAPPGLGKTKLVQQYRENSGVVITTESTFYSIIKTYGDAIQQGQVRHIVIPDMAPIVNRSPREAAMRELSGWGALVEDGVTNWRSGRSVLAAGPTPVLCGVVFCITPYSYKEKLSMLGDEGFIGRFLVASYSYPQEMIHEVRGQIAGGQLNGRVENRMLRKLAGPQEIRMVPGWGKYLLMTGLLDRVRDSSDTGGFRMQHRLHTLLKANALRHGRTDVILEDMNDLERMAPYLGPNMAFVA
jgi:hypothetical protein